MALIQCIIHNAPVLMLELKNKTFDPEPEKRCEMVNTFGKILTIYSKSELKFTEDNFKRVTADRLFEFLNKTPRQSGEDSWDELRNVIERKGWYQEKEESTAGKIKQ